MAYTAKKLTKTYTILLFPSITRVSWQRYKQVWPLLSVIWLAMVMLITLVCIEPLFARVTTAAQFQDLARSSQDGPFLTAVAGTAKPTLAAMQQVETQFTAQLRTSLGSYVKDSSPVVLKTPDLQLLSPSPGATAYYPGGRPGTASGGPKEGTPTGGIAFSLAGYDLTQIADQVKVVEGRLPDSHAQTLEIAISEKTALDLKLQVGSDLKIRYPVSAGSTVWQLHVVGLIQIQPSAGDFWHALVNTSGDADLKAYHGDGNMLYDGAIEYNALMARSTLLTETAKISSTENFGGFFLTWSYPVNLDRLTANTISDFLERYQTWRIAQNTHVDNLTPAWIAQSDFLVRLSQLQSHVIYGQIIAFILLYLTMALALLMTGTLLYVLIERQMPVIAAMRSRGASRSYVFGTFATQGTLLVLLAVGAGPLLAFLLVRFLTASLLSQANQSALDFFAQDFSRVWLEVRWLVLVIGVITFVTMLIALYRATGIDIATFRRETARATRAPFWRRFYLDVILAGLICIGYGLYIYSFTSSLAHHGIVIQLQTLFSLIAGPLILVAVLLLFLRIMPRLFHLATRVASRTSSTVALLAFAQIERSPRAASRLILLLAIALASSTYLLNLADTQLQFPPIQVNFQVGADFRGQIDPTNAKQSFSQLMQQYRSLAGVQAVTLGYTASNLQPSLDFALPSLSLDAVDADTYASTAVWSSDYSQRSLALLMQELKAHRAEASSQDIVYAIADENTWNTLSLSPGLDFTLTMPGYKDGKTMHFRALEQVSNIPGIYDSPTVPYSGLGLLVDYQSYTTVYTKDNASVALQPNTVWLRTADDAASLASVRRAEPAFLDRRALLDAARVDPASVNMLSIFGIGIGAALGLALLGMQVVSWVSISNRRVHFAALSALGMPARQITAILVWEHASACGIALLLALGLGWLFSFNVVPAFNLINNAVYNQGLPTASVPPVHGSFPFVTALVLFGAFLLIDSIVLMLMAYAASHSARSRVLRLNED